MRFGLGIFFIICRFKRKSLQGGGGHKCFINISCLIRNKLLKRKYNLAIFFIFLYIRAWIFKNYHLIQTKKRLHTVHWKRKKCVRVTHNDLCLSSKRIQFTFVKFIASYLMFFLICYFFKRNWCWFLVIGSYFL